MTITLPLTPTEEAQLLAQARARGTTPEDLVRQAIEPILSAVPENLPDAKKPRRRISEVITERMKALPPEVFDRLPKDGASEHDHIIVGIHIYLNAQTGHRRMILSAAASAQSIAGLPCVAGSAIKTIVAMGALPRGDLTEIATRVEPSPPSEIFDWKRISNSRHARYFNK